MLKVIRNIVIIILSVLILAYFAMVLLSRYYFIPGTIINGVNYSFKTPVYVENQMKSDPVDYSLELIFRNDKSELITGQNIGLAYDYYTSIMEVKNSQNPFLWFSIYKGKEYTVERTLSFKEEQLDRVLAGLYELKDENMIAPENPVIEMDEEFNIHAIMKEPGTTIKDIEGLKRRIARAIQDEETFIDVDAEGFYALPKFPVDGYKVQSCLDYCNEIADLKIYYMYGDCEIPFTRRMLFDTIKISDTFNYAISLDRVEGVLKRYSYLHDTYGKDRVFRTHSRQYINVTDADYGWEINIEEEADLLYSDLIHKRNVSRTPIFSHEGFVYTEDKSDIGDTYVEVDLTNQMCYVFQEGAMTMSSPCVTGNVNRGNATPTGLYYIYYKQSPSLLTGGETPVWVDYWMPFNRGIGLHDAKWRYKFGDEIYISNGSHGCVNLPWQFSHDLYYIAEAGMPVVVY